jgi:TolB protein
MLQRARGLRASAGLAAVGLCAVAGAQVGVRAQSVVGEKVVFVSNRDGDKKMNIFTMNLDGSGQKNLTNTEGGTELDPVFSPDGKRIAFAVMPNGEKPQSDLYVMNSDGTGRTRIVEGAGLAFSPSWSPDGKRLLYTTAVFQPAIPPAMMLHVMDADGKNDEQRGEGFGAIFSPDGKSILFTKLKEQGDIALMIAKADGTEPKALVEGKAAFPQFSPDGKKIAYMAEGGGNQADLFIMDIDGKNGTAVTSTMDAMEFCPQWSPDGKRLYFMRFPKAEGQDALSGAEIFTIDADGKNEKQLTTNSALDSLGGGLLILRSTPK